jgi:2-dehydro-3-deoxy-D-gluconate 5-dehydrogenase
VAVVDHQQHLLSVLDASWFLGACLAAKERPSAIELHTLTVPVPLYCFDTQSPEEATSLLIQEQRSSLMVVDDEHRPRGLFVPQPAPVSNDWGPFSLVGQVAIVTGAAMGIGFGICRRMHEAGASLLMLDKNAQALEIAHKKLESTPRPEQRVVAMELDVQEQQAPERMVARCLESFGRLDILVNNAGIFPRKSLLKLDRAGFDRVMDINLRSLVFLSQAAARWMTENQTPGRIINIGSIDSVHPTAPGLTAYDASKGAVLMFTKSLALELAPFGVLVNAVLPGGIDTEGSSQPMRQSALSEAEKQAIRARFIHDKMPLGRLGTPDDIGKAVVFLASSASDYLTGSALLVDGGTLLR